MMLKRRDLRADGLKPHQISRSWSDEFGSLIATLEGRTGGRKLMVIVRLEDAKSALQIVQSTSSFKGRILFAVLEHLHAAPLVSVFRNNQPNVVVALEPNCAGIAIRGAGIRLESEQMTASTGTSYSETGRYAVWSSKPLESKITSTLQCSSVTASVASNLKIACATCDLAHLPGLLEMLLV
jgi:hypothetical protein